MQPHSSSLFARRSAFSVIIIDGARIDDYLQGQITQDITRLRADTLLYSALLTPQGKAVCDLWLTTDGAQRLLIVPSASLDAAITRLRRFSLGYTLSIKPATSLHLWSLQGAGSSQLVRERPHCWPMAEAADEGYWLLDSTAPAITAPPVNESVIERARIIHGTPRFGIDWHDFPLNANLIERDGISFDKGCFVGQEVTSRMRWRSGIRKTPAHLRLERLPDTLPAPLYTSVPVATLTSAARDDRGVCFGIGQLPCDILAAATPLTLADGSAIAASPLRGRQGVPA